MSVAAISDPTHAYRREARKLRGRLVDRPAELYRSLRQLSDRHDELQSFQEPPAASPASEFAAEVRELLQSGVLTYSTRQRLLESAGERKIARFEANLIIAAVQHRYPVRVSETASEASSPSRLATIAVFVLAQCAVILAIWGVLVH